jgi:hypothetical protein
VALPVSLMRSFEVEGLMKPHRVVEMQEGFHLFSQLRRLAYLPLIEVLILER